jgi:hypothetical protein
VIGIGFLAAAETPVIADESFAVVIAALALAAIFVDFRSRRPRAPA